MITLWLETVLVGNVVHGVQDTIGTGVRVATGGRLTSDAALLSRETVARLVPVLVGTVRVDDGVLFQDLGLGIGVLGGGQCKHGRDDNLKVGEEVGG